MRIEAIYIIYNIYTLLAYSSNSNYLKISKIKSTILKIIEIRINISIDLEISNYQHHLSLIIIIRNISRSKLIIFLRENYLNRLISRLNSR